MNAALNGGFHLGNDVVYDWLTGNSHLLDKEKNYNDADLPPIGANENWISTGRRKEMCD